MSVPFKFSRFILFELNLPSETPTQTYDSSCDSFALCRFPPYMIRPCDHTNRPTLTEHRLPLDSHRTHCRESLFAVRDQCRTPTLSENRIEESQTRKGEPSSRSRSSAWQAHYKSRNGSNRFLSKAPFLHRAAAQEIYRHGVQ
jgi:hypothetical protein